LEEGTGETGEDYNETGSRAAQVGGLLDSRRQRRDVRLHAHLRCKSDRDGEWGGLINGTSHRAYGWGEKGEFRALAGRDALKRGEKRGEP